MSHIRNVHDTFLSLLADNLTGITVRELRFDPNDPTANVIQIGALNVTFLNRQFAIMPTSVQVTLDVCYGDQLGAMDVEEQVALLFQRAAFTPVLDYTVLTSPVPEGNRTMSWKPLVSFRPIVTDNYYHSTATINLIS